LVNKILNPVEIYEEIDYPLKLNDSLISKERFGDCILEKVRYNGKPISGEYVRIYAEFLYKEGREHDPALLILNDMDKSIDRELMQYFLSLGYSVLMPDYRGRTKENADDDNYTVYLSALNFANYESAGRHIDKATPSVRETSWFEWAGVAKYSCDYLKFRKVEKIGVIGIRAGGEIAWKILQDKDISCCITLNAAGWLAYRNFPRHGEKPALTDERCRFIAGIDSQSYAPFVNCPVMILGSARDPDFEIDRAYDTFARIKPGVDKAISYSFDYNGYFGENAKKNITLFLRKYLDEQEVFISDPAVLSIDRDRNGNLVASVEYDEESSVIESNVYFAENVAKPSFREWNKAIMQRFDGGKHSFLIDVCDKAKSVSAVAYYISSNGFTTVSKVIEFQPPADCRNFLRRNPVMYSSKNEPKGFYKLNFGKYTLGNLFISEGTNFLPEVKTGALGIKGLSCSEGIKTYLVGTAEYAPEQSSALAFDVFSEKNFVINISIIKIEEGKEVAYNASRSMKGKDSWQKAIFEPDAFYYTKKNTDSIKDDMVTMNTFCGASVLVIRNAEESFLVNNIIWI